MTRGSWCTWPETWWSACSFLGTREKDKPVGCVPTLVFGLLTSQPRAVKDPGGLPDWPRSELQPLPHQDSGHSHAGSSCTVEHELLPPSPPSWHAPWQPVSLPGGVVGSRGPVSEPS